MQHQPHHSTTTALSDRLSLLSFKSVISDAATGSLASWNDSLHYCRWRGVTCGRRHPGRVVALDLTSLQLAGPISPVLGNLTFLRRLNLSDNALHGSMPPEIGRLSRLRHLNLSINSLGGRIPATLSRCSRLKMIDLSENKLQGEIPGDLGNCLDLQIIYFYDNQLSGGIPPTFGNLSSLTSLALGRNTLSGGIPPSLGKLSSLTVLHLAFNNLTGGIPPSLWNLSSVVSFGLQYNQLNASLPPYLGQALPRLRFFYMSQVLLHGSIPMSLANASYLHAVELSDNALTGRIPPNLGSLHNLSFLDLYDNQLEAVDPDGWSFITGLTNCTNLQTLELEMNNLGGALPNSIVNLSTSLWFLSLGRSHISGSIPPQFGNLVGLAFLIMGPNLLTGPIPPSFGKLQLLERLDLDSNILSGEIPSTIGNLTHLEELYLDVNDLSGSLPANLGLCQHLLVINLGFNKLTGTIPKEIFSIYTLSIGLGLAHNSLAGPLPSEVGNLKNLEQLDISENNFSGEIPSSLGECLALNFISIEGNFFHGTIPPSLRNITAIQQLNLSHNQLSGHIPDFLKDFRSLQYLNLSFNNFEGEVPTGGVFENMSAVSVQGNNNLCGGNAQLQLPPCPNQAPRKKHSTPGLPVIIAVTGAALCLLLFLILGFCYVKRKSTKKSSGTTALLKEQHMKVSYADLLRSTEGFSPASLIGVGSFGSVYRGTLDEKVVAVKVLNLQQTGAVKSFMAECEVLKNVRHRNLVKIITACSSVDFRGNNFKAMVFEFMNNGSLDSWLHSEDDGQPRSKKLNLRQRLSIAIDVASALDYLHNHGQRPIIHCDLKPSNILLDDDMTAHVGDFGLARFLKQTTSKSSQNSTNSAGLKGTIGYVAPEYGVANRVSTQGDVYSFGILVLEMFTGKRPTDHAFKEGLSLRDYVKASLPNGVMDAVDEYMLLEEEEVGIGVESTPECVASMLRIGLLCSNELPMDRMEMGAAVKELHAIRDAFLRAGM